MHRRPVPKKEQILTYIEEHGRIVHNDILNFFSDYDTGILHSRLHEMIKEGEIGGNSYIKRDEKGNFIIEEIFYPLPKEEDIITYIEEHGDMEFKKMVKAFPKYEGDAVCDVIEKLVKKGKITEHYNTQKIKNGDIEITESSPIVLSLD